MTLQSSSAKPGEDALSCLVVFDRLVVGPVKIRRDRLTAPYMVVKKKKILDECELIYAYEEPVFTDGEAESQNLAGMVAAQLALNYGLFFREIEFRGIFDESDRHFIRCMAENTAREIYVRKFLQPNPFIIGKPAHVPLVLRDSYLNARFDFPDSDSSGAAVSLKPWEASGNRHAVLSSGGKDSLLSYGLIREICGEAHPVFINESGRHWFTALNAYRYFTSHAPGTTRVWVNSDRVFARMTRLFPFVRKDYASFRADDYPIRLWTVAVFLFGALPIMRKRGLNRLIIGDEYDTTWVDNYRGIENYKGYYDQSIYFDRTLTEYFSEKKWNITQFSLLRPLSELLIEKTLCERYPRLQAQQVSCHATHKDGERVKPCGRCEKCRRVVGMLLSLDVDPRRCGYTPAQIEEIKSGLGFEGLHQESEGVKQLFHMLYQKKLVKFQGETLEEIKPHPEILKVRIDPENSPISDIPRDLRQALYRIYLEHAIGSARKIGKEWLDYDILNDPQVAGG